MNLFTATDQPSVLGILAGTILFFAVSCILARYTKQDAKYTHKVN